MTMKLHLPPQLPWRKSSYSGPYDDNCVEMARVPDSWRKSTHSSGSGDECVEVGTLADGTAIRDSNNPTGPIVTVSRAAWRNFIGGLRTRDLA